ncbi:MAG: M13 family metallopeptidase, partial [Oscillospiraceae bacterium]|nr:M13 family metallopeptidase [Oscillospiraceae bacterium]
MKKTLCMLLAVLLLASVGAPVLADETGGDGIDYTTGTPWMDTDLEGNVTPDTPTDLKDNFALWANKDRILSMEYLEGYLAAGNSSDVNYKVGQDLKGLFRGEAPEDHDSRLAYDYFYLLSDWDSRNARGVEPLKALVDAVEGITGLDALTEYFVETPWENRLTTLWGERVRQDPDKPGWNILSVNNGYSFLNDPEEYRELTEDGKAIKDTFDAFFMEILTKLGYSEAEAEQKIENCFAWETLMNTAVLDAEEAAGLEDPSPANVHYTRDELLAATPNIPILETFEKADGYPALEQYLIPHPAAIESLNRLYTEENLPLMRDYLILHGIYLKAEATDWDSYVRVCDCQEVAGGGRHFELSREEFDNSPVYDEMKSAVGWPLSRYYVQQHASPEDKARITELVDEIVDAYYGIIEDADFISDETRAGAIAKLDSMARHVLYPDSWEPYSFADVTFASKEEGGRLWEAWLAVKKHEHAKTVAELISPIDSTVWDLLPCVGNCGYTPAANSISINAAYAQAPNYRPDMTEEELYAYMGTAIAHEISHAFDAFGAKFDKDGNISDWWTEEDYAAFSRKNEKLIAYFNAMHPWEGQDFDGEIMVGEACADMAALKCMLRIAAGKPGFDYDRFFRAFADRFATKETLLMEMARLADEHPLAYLRINTSLQQYDEFLDFYGITEGDNMYLAPEDRVALWGETGRSVTSASSSSAAPCPANSWRQLPS